MRAHEFTKCNTVNYTPNKTFKQLAPYTQYEINENIQKTIETYERQS